MDDFKQALRELLQETEFINKFRDSIVKPAVAEVIEVRLTEMTNKIEVLEEELTTVTEKLGAAERKIEALEAYSRRNCLTISGIPEEVNEETDQLVLDVAKSTGVMLSPDDIDVSHRVGRPKDNRPRNIIVKFLAYNVREKLFSARKDKSTNRVRGHSVLTAETLSNVYIAEALTPETQKLLFICRQLKAQKRVWAAYTTNGRVKVKTAQNQTAKLITSVADLEKLVGDACVREILSTAQPDGSRGGPAGPAGNADAAPPAVRGAGQGARRGDHPTGSRLPQRDAKGQRRPTHRGSGNAR